MPQSQKSPTFTLPHEVIRSESPCSLHMGWNENLVPLGKGGLSNNLYACLKTTTISAGHWERESEKTGGRGEFWLNFKELLGVSKAKKNKAKDIAVRVSPGQSSGDAREQRPTWEVCRSSVQVEWGQGVEGW